MSKINDGGPAFPRTGEGFGNPKYDTAGMTLRDWFAGQALNGFIVNAMMGDKTQKNLTDTAALAFAVADAMIAESQKQEPHDA